MIPQERLQRRMALDELTIVNERRIPAQLLGDFMVAIEKVVKLSQIAAVDTVPIYAAVLVMVTIDVGVLAAIGIAVARVGVPIGRVRIAVAHAGVAVGAIAVVCVSRRVLITAPRIFTEIVSPLRSHESGRV